MKRLGTLAALGVVALVLGAAPPAQAEGWTALAGTQGGYYDSYGLGPVALNLTGSWNGGHVIRATYTCFGEWTGEDRGEKTGTMSCTREDSLGQGKAPTGFAGDVWFAADDAGLYGMYGILTDFTYFDCSGASADGNIAGACTFRF